MRRFVCRYWFNYDFTIEKSKWLRLENDYFHWYKSTTQVCRVLVCALCAVFYVTNVPHVLSFSKID